MSSATLSAALSILSPAYVCCIRFRTPTSQLPHLLNRNKFETQIKANISHANDWPTGDPDGLHDRPNLLGLVSTEDNEYLQIAATGIQTPIPELGAIITGKGAGDLPFGAFQSGKQMVVFQTSKYKTQREDTEAHG